jgi:hypothetical protein
MRRRAFMTLLGGATTWPLAVRAQQPERMRRIGVLMSVEEKDPEGNAELSQFTQGLAESGWIDGRNLRIEVRWGGGDVNRTRTFAKELVAPQPGSLLGGLRTWMGERPSLRPARMTQSFRLGRVFAVTHNTAIMQRYGRVRPLA